MADAVQEVYSKVLEALRASAVSVNRLDEEAVLGDEEKFMILKTSGNKNTLIKVPVSKVKSYLGQLSIYRGTYNPETGYSRDEKVLYQGNLWICIKETGTAVGITPGTDETVWIEQAPDNYTGYRIEKRSSAGSEFYTEGQTSYAATFALVCYYNDKNITDTLPETRFIWERVSEDTTGDLTWNQLHENKGNSVTVTYQDLAGDTTFICSFLDAGGSNLISSQSF